MAFWQVAKNVSFFRRFPIILESFRAFESVILASFGCFSQISNYFLKRRCFEFGVKIYVTQKLDFGCETAIAKLLKFLKHCGLTDANLFKVNLFKISLYCQLRFQNYLNAAIQTIGNRFIVFNTHC